MKHLHRTTQARQRIASLFGMAPLVVAALVTVGLQPPVANGAPADKATATPSEVILRPPAARPAPARPAANKANQARSKAARRRSGPAANLASTQDDAARTQEAAEVAVAAAELRTARIQTLLAQAQRDYDAGRLVAPPRNNAVEAYRDVLTLDPNQLEALAGARRIISVIAAEAERAALAGDRSRTQQYIAAIRALRPEDPALPELTARLRAMTESPVVLSVRQQERYGRSAESIERAYEALQRQPLDKQAIDAALAEYDQARALVSQSPGLPMLKNRIIVAFPAATRNELAQDNSRRALRVVEAARERGWLTPELEALETTAKADTTK